MSLLSRFTHTKSASSGGAATSKVLRQRAGSSVALVSVATLLLAGCGTVTSAEPGEHTSAAEFTVTDEQGREITLAAPAESAVVLNSYGNEFVRAIGAGDRVVGVDSTSLERLPYLEVSEENVISQGLQEINYEAIVELDPDVVIMPRNAVWEESAKQLEPFGIPVIVATAWDYAVFDDTIDLLGEVFGAQEGAQRVTDFHDEITDLVAERVAGLEPKSVYFESVEPYLTALPGSGFHALIEASGGTNIFADTSGGDAQEELTVEPAEVVVRNPDLILHESEPASTPLDPQRMQQTRTDIANRPGWAGITAVQNNQVYVTSGWATSALAKAIGSVYLASWLHPEAFSDVNPNDYFERWVNEFQDTEFAGADAYISTPGSDGDAE